MNQQADIWHQTRSYFVVMQMNFKTSASPRRIRSLMLAGGLSSRMGSPKYLLRHPTGQAMYLRTLNLLQTALSSATEVFVSIRSADQIVDFTEATDFPVSFISDSSVLSSFAGDNDIGPAAGLLAAHEHDKSASWLVLGCDYPLATGRALKQLINEYEEPLTCFDGIDGFCEPLFAIWSPSALNYLKENVVKGVTSPMKVVQGMESKVLKPEHRLWIMGTNTPEQWIEAVRLFPEVDSD